MERKEGGREGDEGGRESGKKLRERGNYMSGKREFDKLEEKGVREVNAGAGES